MLNPGKIIFLVLIAAAPALCLAQNKHVIEFNEKGQITYPMPSMLKEKSKVRFLLKTSQEDSAKRVVAVYTRFLETIKNLDQKDDTKKYYLILQKAGLQTNKPAITRLQMIQSDFASQLIAILDIPAYSAMIQNSPRDVAVDKLLLKSFVRTAVAQKPALNLPVIKDLMSVRYFVNNIFLGGDNPAGSDPLLCTQIIELAKTTKCCDIQYSSADYVDFKKYRAKNFFKDSIELRVHNAVYADLSKQIKNFNTQQSFMGAVDYKSFQAGIAAFNKGNADRTALFVYMDNRIKGNDNAVEKARLAPLLAGAPTNAIMVELDRLINLTPVKSPNNIFFLLDLSWLTRGQYLTANPLQVTVSSDITTKVTTATKVLADSTQHLADVVQRISDLEKTFSTNNAAAAAQGITSLLGKMQGLKNDINASITDQKKTLDGLKKQQQQQADLAAQNSKGSILSDSLLNAGAVTVNPHNGNFFFSPNNLNYHYMRNHNALQNLNSFDLNYKKDINEHQRIDAYLINANPKQKFVLTETFADAPKEMDFVSMEATAASAPGNAAAHPTIEDIYEQYTLYLSLLTPYQNGSIGTSIQEIRDKTPDYLTVSEPVRPPDKVIQIATYTVQDTTNKKSTPVSFTYRYNKLYRFRFKAGFAYSWLEKRNYTINTAANTATYTNSYTGLAPNFGIQIFTSKLDIQSSRFLPTGAYPFLYVGYIFNDAPANNFLLGGGFELFSGFSVIGGFHLGKTQGLTVSQGNLQEKDYFKAAPFISVSIGLEAFSALFNTAKIPTPTNK